MDMKCGEVFLSENCNLIFLCTLCDTKFKEFQAYADHTMDKHFLFDVVDNEEESIAPYARIMHSELERLEDDFVELEDGFQLIEEIEILQPNENITEDYEILEIATNIINEPTNVDEQTNLQESVKIEEETVNSIKERIYKCNSNVSKSSRKCYRCWECDREFHSRIGYRKHYHRHVGERKYHCTKGECGESFITFNAYKRHTEHCKYEHLPFEAECTECGMHFYNKDHFQKHAKAHSQPFKCEKCNVGLKTARGLQRHLKSHGAGKHEIICQLCSISFNDQTALLNHLKTTHSGASQVKVYIRQA